MEETKSSGPFHEFCRLNEVPERVSLSTPRAAGVRIADDVLDYLVPTLAWSMMGQGMEWNRYGVNVLAGEAASTTGQILAAWIAIFECAPPTFSLPYGFDPDAAQFAHVEISRDALLTDLRTLHQWFSEVGEGNGAVVHLGI